MSITFENMKRTVLGILGANGEDLDPDTNLLEEGILDSLQVLELATALEEGFEIRLDPYDFTPENFRSLQSLLALVLRKRPRTHKAAM